MKKVLLFLLIACLTISIVSAKEITLSLNQSEYYFLVGEQAIIPLETENTYDNAVQGIFTHTTTYETNQGGLQYSSTNSQSQSFTIEQGENTVNVAFGTVNTPSSLLVSLRFDFNGDQVVNLDDILIIFVSDQSQKENDDEKKQSSSKQAKSQSQKSLAQKVQQQIDELFKEPQQETPQQKVQNNQMPQDSSALKEQMQKQMEQQRKTNEEFANELSNNQEFQDQQQELQDQGFNQTNANIDATNSTSGDFEVNYEKDGDTTSLKGSMENKNLTKIQKTQSRDIKSLMEQLRQDERFQNYNQQLLQQNFTELPSNTQQVGNLTHIKIPYQNQNNETATISATIENEGIKNIDLKYSKKPKWWIWTLGLILLLTIAFLIYRKYFIKNPGIQMRETVEKPINYKKEALKLLEEAKKLFNDKKEKDAYGKASEAIRFYYSYKLCIKKELTSFELIKLLKNHKIKFDQTQKCLNLCGLVEFAKYKANKKDFEDIIVLARKIIG